MEVHNYAVENEFGYAQTRRQLEVANASLRRAPLATVVRIPVVVHVLFARDDQNVGDDQIQEQIAALNRDFRARNDDLTDTPGVFTPLIGTAMIEFALATRDPSGQATTGITRTRTSIQTYPQSMIPGTSRTAAIDREVKVDGSGAAAWPREHYLNLWVCDMDLDPLGYAAFPGSAAWRDGVVVDLKCFGTGGTAEAPFDLGRTTVHEVGHWLDLLHIWGDDGGACSRSDNVGDTPNQGNSNFGTPAFPTISCNNAPNGDLFVNYMDYVDDQAMVMFSKGQIDRMHAALQGARASLLVSPGLNPPDADGDPAATPLGRVARIAAAGAVAPGAMVFDGVTWVPVTE